MSRLTFVARHSVTTQRIVGCTSAEFFLTRTRLRAIGP